ncbi:hepatocellular carcinoma-associated antigen 59-domain-containing protein [Cunninghamella echinulata]|nr:hepatocellular carcinoma-associated antigen 59-domain-containing protein [Cunninghamella echinulata]
MPIVKKQRNYRKKINDSDEEIEKKKKKKKSTTKNVNETIEELQEIRRLRRKHGGVDAEKLLKGEKKKVKVKKPTEDSNAWSLQSGGLVDKDTFATGKGATEDEGKGKKIRLDTFTSQTNKVDVDKHMMNYIETELRKKRGEDYVPEDENDQVNKEEGIQDIYQELYHLPDRLKFATEAVKEGNVQHSTQMLTAIPEVDLGISAQLRNIEETERAKRKLMESTEKKNDNNARIINHRFDHGRKDRRQWATDEAVEERFKKRMRK